LDVRLHGIDLIALHCPDEDAMSRRFFRYPWWHYVVAAVAIVLIWRFIGGTTPAF